MGSSHAPYSVLKGFSNLASKSRRYSQFFVDSQLSYIAESWYSPYCSIWIFVTPRVVYGWELQMYELCAETLGCRLIWRVKTPIFFKNKESLFPALFVARSHCWQQGVLLKHFEVLVPPEKRHWSLKINHACRALLTKKMLKCQKYWLHMGDSPLILNFEYE